jgi:pimeloyl-ACP methyl ester carboxylesterase
MAKWVLIAAFVLLYWSPRPALAACRAGIYGNLAADFVALGTPTSATPTSPKSQRYLFVDGRRGNLGEAGALVSCDRDVATLHHANGSAVRMTRVETKETATSIESWGETLAGRLIEPPGPVDNTRPLVVFVHGSERNAAIGGATSYMLVAQGVSVFVYDKRGTGESLGTYTQNFELLADDAAAALAKARSLAAGRFGRAGYYGGSQGGWVAPLAATRSTADFVAVGFGLVASPITEDREQMLQEAEAAGLDAKAQALIRRLSDATAGLVRSHFERGYEALARVKRQIGNAPWASTIRGEYSGSMLRLEEAELRRVGRAIFDELELLWDYDGVTTLKKLRVPLLWVLAAQDREAPVDTTRQALLALQREKKAAFDIYVFPDTDHGMVEFKTNPDGSRTVTRVTDGYLRLLGDWFKGKGSGPYGRGELIQR